MKATGIVCASREFMHEEDFGCLHCLSAKYTNLIPSLFPKQTSHAAGQICMDQLQGHRHAPPEFDNTIAPCVKSTSFPHECRTPIL